MSSRQLITTHSSQLDNASSQPIDMPSQVTPSPHSNHIQSEQLITTHTSQLDHMSPHSIDISPHSIDMSPQPTHTQSKQLSTTPQTKQPLPLAPSILHTLSRGEVPSLPPPHLARLLPRHRPSREFPRLEREPANSHHNHSQRHSRLRVAQSGHFQRSVAQLFLHPVSIHMEGCRSYYHVIKKPMDLTTIMTKNARNEYKSLDSFSRDFHTMIRNCCRFNVIAFKT